MSHVPVTSQNPHQSIERSFLDDCPSNQPMHLSTFVNELQTFKDYLQHACTSRTLTPDLSRRSTATAANIYVVASVISESHSGIEIILGDFSAKLCIFNSEINKDADGSVALHQLHYLAKNSPATSLSSPPTFQPNASDNKGTPGDQSHDILKNWSIGHLSFLFPTKDDLLDLASQTGLTENQVNLWFRNARTRSGWSKLYTNKLYANKDRQKLQQYLDDHEALRRLHGDTISSVVGLDDAYHLVEKIMKWFGVKKNFEASPSLASSHNLTSCDKAGVGVKPQVKEVLFNALASLRSASTSASPPKRKPSYRPALGWPKFFGRSNSDAIDPELRSSSLACSSDDATESSRSTSTSSTWSSISSNSSRSSSPCAPSSSSRSMSGARSPSASCSSSPRSTTTCLFLPLAPAQASSTEIFSPAGSQASTSDSRDPQLGLPPLHPSLVSDGIILPQPTSHEPSLLPAMSSISSPINLDPRLDTPTPLLSLFSSDAFSPPSPTHEPCSVAFGQFDDAEEE
ncbi:hypothetical protein CROQUDRAFT_661465 [Cronartium quercuum f. sp. fusiforme G11]|uniref:Homeobox domain-containing protein n=1 Tax=Cronartium quercuum f. sp. fusiforme G11 TaxID=708437 RepID=A0A9P6T8N7_9BASI|nr:hypothetical protein CROQUDRAFT_661465 [Cronartium quercuum f. sp. fusiforme G11]